MDFFDGYYDMLKSFNYELVKYISTPTPNPSPLQNSKINFIFSFNFEVSKWILGEEDVNESELVHRSTNPQVDYLVPVGRFSSTEEIKHEDTCKKSSVLCQSISTTVKIWSTMPCNEASKHKTECSSSLSLHFNVLLEHEYIFLYEEVHDDYDESSFLHMVPAKDSSIQVLKKVEGAGYSRRNMDCSICLEKLFDGDCYREALSMPCSHIFHADCIKNWLRVSHYCPLCRFEIPTD